MNLQEKFSGLKGLVTPSHGKRRFRGDLTLEMISPPLGDFRHTMHVGRGGDVFGDTSFLSNHGGPANGSEGEADSVSAPDNKIGAFFSRTLRHIRRGSDNRPAGGPGDLSPPPPAVSPIVKNAISLPRLDVEMPNGSPAATVLFPSSQSTPEETKSSYGLESGFVTLPRLSRSERQQPSVSLPTSCPPNVHRGSLTDPTDALLSTGSTAPFDPELTFTARSDSLPSLMSLDTFTFDLGPSLMSEVFGLIDGHPEESGHAWEGSAFGLTTEGSEMDSATISYVDSLQREDCGGGKSPQGGAEWEDEEVSGAGPCDKAAEVASSGSPGRGRSGLGMASEHFQSAADVLARHYGVGPSRGRSGTEVTDSEEPKDKISYSYMDDEDEIKV
ncbi:cdc42 effector protein 1 [Pungitius pungitius]|uniref:cdc42 effector protein 1 n=1 Tax=Pungitius pungitius TaxID=134920 RepID=UPI001886B926|nr:cdc42 effector protein 1 [Pungitius pungitius]XP_037319623.1 cdc42 effector protein 1 [Pungitius pungitius]XP_037319624.1 cdc42 effector protein 1 [Pungitius pungitius]